MKLLKLFVKAFVVGFVVYMACTHLMHEALVDGYLNGCKDTILEGAKTENLTIPNDVLESYCHALSHKYVERSQ
jgi:hypothetical protein